MRLDETANQIFIIAYNEAKLQCHEFVTPEHILAALMFFEAGKKIIVDAGGSTEKIQSDLQAFFDEQIPKTRIKEPVETESIQKMFSKTAKKAEKRKKTVIGIDDIMRSFYEIPESSAVQILEKNGVDKRIILEMGEAETQSASLGKSLSDVKVRDEENLIALHSFISDMTQKASDGKFDPLIGREDLVARTEQVLLRRTKNNPIYVGEPGVGKTALVEGIARLIALGNAPGNLANCKIFNFDLAAALAGTKFRGDFEDRLKNILETIAQIKDAIIYIDEIHTIVGTGAAAGGTMDAANILKPYLTEGRLRVIGSTTYDEYRRFIEKDKALSRRFQKIEVPEPGEDEAVKILEGLKDKYADFHNVSYPNKTLSLAVSLSSKYISDRFLPDKAIDIIDEAGAAARIKEPDIDKTVTITEKHIERAVSLIAKVPEKTVSSSETLKLKALFAELKKQVFGQDYAIDAIVSAIKRSRSGFSENEKPVASLLFVGPSGVGKTEVARALADALDIKLLRFDMSEYQEKHTVSRLIGAPPGYVGYDDGGVLAEQIRKTPHAVLLLDEMEKAHIDIQNVLLQIMDYGTLTDTAGKTADFKNTIIIMTSNAGAADIGKSPIGFGGNAEINVKVAMEAVNKAFSPEFRNRLDEIIMFNQMDIDTAKKIVSRELKVVSEKLKERGMKLTVSGAATEHIAKSALCAQYGAREIMRVIDTQIKRKLVDHLLFGEKTDGAYIKISLKNGELIVKM